MEYFGRRRRRSRRTLVEPTVVSGRWRFFRTEYCTTLSDAVVWLQHHQADLVLLDQSLPDGEGLPCLTRIRETAPEVPIVLMTGLSDDDVARSAIEQGAAAYLIKGDLSPSQIVKTLEDVVSAAHCAHPSPSA